MSENPNGVTVTFKAAQGYEAPWIVIHADSVTDAKNQIDTGDFAALAERTVAAAEFFRGAYNVKHGLASNEAPAQPQAPQQNRSQQGSPQTQAPAAPQGGGKQCIHGDMVFRSGNKNGRAWSGYFCPTPKGTPNQCSPVFG